MRSLPLFLAPLLAVAFFVDPTPQRSFLVFSLPEKITDSLQFSFPSDLFKCFLLNILKNDFGLLYYNNFNNFTIMPFNLNLISCFFFFFSLYQGQSAVLVSITRRVMRKSFFITPKRIPDFHLFMSMKALTLKRLTYEVKHDCNWSNCM